MRSALLFASLALAWPLAHADCQDVCTDIESNCNADCSKTGFATLGCTTRCTKSATTCVKKTCTTPRPKPKNADSVEQLLTSPYRAAYPLDLGATTGSGGVNLNADGCCKAAGAKAPACAYVKCRSPEWSAKNAQSRDWSGKLFDTASGPVPTFIYTECGTRPAAVCAILKPDAKGISTGLSTRDATVYRRQLEAFRRTTDYARATGQISDTQYKGLIGAYKADHKRAFGTIK